MNTEGLPCEACLGTGGLELNGGTSMSNDYIECDMCEGTGENQALSELLAAFKEAVEENPLVLKDEEPLNRDMPYEGEFIGE